MKLNRGNRRFGLAHYRTEAVILLEIKRHHYLVGSHRLACDNRAVLLTYRLGTEERAGRLEPEMELTCKDFPALHARPATRL